MIEPLRPIASGVFLCCKLLMENLQVSLWGLFVSAFISSTIAPGGSEAVVAYMVSNASHTVDKIILTATIGNTLGALTTWFLGSLAEKKLPVEKLLTKHKQQAINSVRKWGVWALLFSWLPLVGDGLCFAGGWLKLTFWPSCVAILIGKAFRYWFIAYIFI